MSRTVGSKKKTGGQRRAAPIGSFPNTSFSNFFIYGRASYLVDIRLELTIFLNRTAVPPPADLIVFPSELIRETNLRPFLITLDSYWVLEIRNRYLFVMVNAD